MLRSERYDVAVIGAGVVGCAIAMELSRYAIRTILIEARSDIGAATSKANSAILHTGFDAVPGSLESELVREGYRRFHEYSECLGLPIGRLGALVVAWDQQQADVLPDIVRKAGQNGVSDLRFIDRDELRSLEPHLAAGASQAVLVPGESITCPFTPPLAFATNAVRNGVTLRRNFRIQSVDRVSGGIELQSETSRVTAGIVINAAGLWSDEIDRLFGWPRLSSPSWRCAIGQFLGDVRLVANPNVTIGRPAPAGADSIPPPVAVPPPAMAMAVAMIIVIVVVIVVVSVPMTVALMAMTVIDRLCAHVHARDRFYGRGHDHDHDHGHDRRTPPPA